MKSLFDRRLVVGGALASLTLAPAVAQTVSDVNHHGVIIRTPDLDDALAFWGDGLGFLIADLRPRDGWARLASNLPIYLEATPQGRLADERIACVEITFQSNDLEASMRSLRGAGSEIISETPYEVAVGRSIRFKDPAGIVHHLLQSSRLGPQFAEPRVYNSGFEVPQAAIPSTRALLEQGLGFIAMTERYFPPSVPYLEQSRSFAFMLHHNQPFEQDLLPRTDPRRDDLGAAQVFVVQDLGVASRAVIEHGAVALDHRARRFSLGRRRAFSTPGGAPFELWSWA